MRHPACMMGCMLPHRLVLIMLCAALCSVSRPAAAQLEQFHMQFETVLKQHGVVGGGFAFIHGAGPATEFFFGEARNDTHQLVDADTAYNWASITKTMTAVAILQLRDRGKLSLDDAAVRYVPELGQVHDKFGPVDEITIRHLLTHSAGFRNPTWPWDCDDPSPQQRGPVAGDPDDTKSCEWQPFEPTRWSQVAAMLPYTHVAFKPGSRWSYSNLGYVFLGQIIERISGDDFEVYIDKNILKPLGMTASYFDRAPYFLEKHVAGSYLRAGKKLTAQPFDFDTGITTSNSGLKAPITDMVKYAQFLIGDGANPVYEVVLKRSSLEEAWKGVLAAIQPGAVPTAYTSGPGGVQPSMGLGFFVMEAGERRYVYHDGDQGGFSSELLIDPGGKSASILAVNTTDTGGPAQDSSHAESNTEPDPHTDLRQALRAVLIQRVFPAYAEK